MPASGERAISSVYKEVKHPIAKEKVKLAAGFLAKLLESPKREGRVEDKQV